MQKTKHEYELYGRMGEDPEYYQEIAEFHTDKQAIAKAKQLYGKGNYSVYKLGQGKARRVD